MEATIAILIVSGVMVTVYSDQSVSFDRTERDYAYSLQNQILEQIAEDRDLRKDVMDVKFDLRGDPAFAKLDDFVASKVPVNVGYILRVCNISDPNDHCKLPSIVFTAIPEKDVFADSVIISSELGNGSSAPVFSPKEVKLFFWEGNVTEDVPCQSECYTEVDVKFCKDDDLHKVFAKMCGTDFDDGEKDKCFEFSSTSEKIIENCDLGELCVEGEGVCSPCKKVECVPRVYTGDTPKYTGLECVNRGYDEQVYLKEIGGGFERKTDEYYCYNYEDIEWSGCSESPTCPVGMELISDSEVPCLCDETAPVVEPEPETPEPPCVVSSWTPNRGNYCPETSVEQTSNCETTRIKPGTKTCAEGYICNAATNTCTPLKANLVASYLLGRTQPSGTYTYHYYTSTISEKNGVGVTINSRQKCYNASDGNKWCDVVSFNIATDYGTNYIKAGGSISDSANYVYFKPGYSYTTKEVFNGTDDNGSKVTASYSFTITI